MNIDKKFSYENCFKIATLESLYNTIVGSHMSDMCYKWTRVLSNGYALCFGQI